MEPAVFDFPHGLHHRALGERLYLQGASFCFKDLAVAVAALDEAERAADLEAGERHVIRARQTVDRLLRVLPHLRLNDEDYESIFAVIDGLRERLFRPRHVRPS